jgi:hypothetical protein
MQLKYWVACYQGDDYLQEEEQAADAGAPAEKDYHAADSRVIVAAVSSHSNPPFRVQKRI